MVVAFRPLVPQSNDSGNYPYVFGPYQFDSSPDQVIPANASILDADCISYVLFRLPASRAPAEFKPPFSPSDYGSDIKVLNSATDGKRCP